MNLTQIIVVGIITVVAAVIAVFLFQIAYKSKTPVPLPRAKPMFAWLPKYFTAIEFPQDIIAAGSPELALGARLAEYGFSESSQNADEVCYTRGSIIGDISVKIVKINLTISRPLGQQSTLTVAAAGPIAFDTGDLWRFTTELKEKLQQ